MQPREPDTSAEPSPPDRTADPMVTPTPSRRSGRLQSRRARLALAFGAGIMALLCLGGVGLFIALYDEATEIDRTAPKVVVVNFLSAFFVNEDDQAAALYQCESGGDFTQLTEFRADTQQREQQHSVGISVTWSNLEETTSGPNSVVDAELTRTISGQGGRDSSSWQFTLVDESGWRVCGAKML
jgi:hypothetical protein